jgi:hypothetical protein
MAQLHEPDASLTLDESDEERAPDHRYVRSLTNSGPVYQLDVGPLHWAVHDAYDEEEGFECHWHKLTVPVPSVNNGNAEARQSAGSAEGKLAWAEAVIDRALVLLQAWQAHKHQLLLRCVPTVLGSTTALPHIALTSTLADL